MIIVRFPNTIPSYNFLAVSDNVFPDLVHSTSSSSLFRIPSTKVSIFRQLR